MLRSQNTPQIFLRNETRGKRFFMEGCSTVHFGYSITAAGTQKSGSWAKAVGDSHGGDPGCDQDCHLATQSAQAIEVDQRIAGWEVLGSISAASLQSRTMSAQKRRLTVAPGVIHTCASHWISP